jgi:hypothetical protein
MELNHDNLTHMKNASVRYEDVERRCRDELVRIKDGRSPFNGCEGKTDFKYFTCLMNRSITARNAVLAVIAEPSRKTAEFWAKYRAWIVAADRVHDFICQMKSIICGADARVPDALYWESKEGYAQLLGSLTTRKVCLRSAAHGTYLGAFGEYVAHNKAMFFWTLVENDDGTVFLKPFGSQVHLSGSDKGKVIVHPNSQDWEKWVIEGDYIRSHKHWMYLSATTYGSVDMQPHKLDWERIIVETATHADEQARAEDREVLAKYAELRRFIETGFKTTCEHWMVEEKLCELESKLGSDDADYLCDLYMDLREGPTCNVSRTFYEESFVRVKQILQRFIDVEAKEAREREAEVERMRRRRAEMEAEDAREAEVERMRRRMAEMEAEEARQAEIERMRRRRAEMEAEDAREAEVERMRRRMADMAAKEARKAEEERQYADFLNCPSKPLSTRFLTDEAEIDRYKGAAASVRVILERRRVDKKVGMKKTLDMMRKDLGKRNAEWLKEVWETCCDIVHEKFEISHCPANFEWMDAVKRRVVNIFSDI